MKRVVGTFDVIVRGSFFAVVVESAAWMAWVELHFIEQPQPDEEKEEAE